MTDHCCFTGSATILVVVLFDVVVVVVLVPVLVLCLVKPVYDQNCTEQGKVG